MIEKLRRAPWVVAIWTGRIAVRFWEIAEIVLIALLARGETAWRRRAGKLPRLIWGPSPLISLKHWSAAMRRLGYQSVTCVDEYYDIYSREDFDRYREDFLPGEDAIWRRREFARFRWVLLHADIIVSFFDYGYLQTTILKSWEGLLLRLAGKKLVVCPYGGDIAVPGHIGVAEEAVLADYPALITNAEMTRERADRVAGWADVAVRNYQFGYMPRSDVLWPTQLAIEVNGAEPASPAAGDEVVVLHAPNHRLIKGTAELLSAIEELRADGVPIRAELLEGRHNSEILAAIDRCDVVADQFIAGYAFFALEGLAAGKPVMSALSWMAPEVRETKGLRACPIVDTDRDSLRANLERLATDPELRAELGRESLEFARRFHSYEAVGQCWKAIFDHLWEGKELPEQLPAS
jgi:glycosyltransferase involved in cell wall biosynthesis